MCVYVAVPKFQFDELLFDSSKLALKHAWHSFCFSSSLSEKSTSIMLWTPKNYKYYSHLCFDFFVSQLFHEENFFSQKIDLRDKWFNVMLISPGTKRWQFQQTNILFTFKCWPNHTEKRALLCMFDAIWSLIQIIDFIESGFERFFFYK